MENSELGLAEQILKIAKHLFINKGYYGLAMREISDELGVSKAALYYHFKDKEQLFLAILQAHLDEMEAGINRIAAESASSADQIRKFAEYVLSQPAEQRATIRLASQEIVHLSPASRKAFGKNYQDKFVGKIQAILQSGMETGEFRVIQIEVATWTLLGMMYPYFYPAHTGEKPVPRETIRELVDIYLRGIEK
ncbi:MAG: TetR/AcrR family transcriptional regulator [Anaerolineales bacterium]|nr:TetR/AcrR family transcriptional regulator [Anaerolineales bacterium]